MFIPKDYKSCLTTRETEALIKSVKEKFQSEIESAMNLERISAPLFVEVNSGLNDNLSGRENAVGFSIKAIDNSYCEVVHSLAKWKRMALNKYGFSPYEGIYTDMNAIRKDEDVLDNLHSVYVDQWDWEAVINKDDRNIDYLKKVVKKLYQAIKNTEAHISSLCPCLEPYLPEEISFITTEELLNLYPDLSPSERENAYLKEKKAAFILNIGGALSNGKPHDLRAPDYDDWSLNGDIFIWYPVLNRAVELSSMGIRVNEISLKNQLDLCNIDKYTNYHKAIFNKVYPLTIGGGIGQSRLCMTLLHKAHVGEVQCSVWDEKNISECEKKGVQLL